MGAAILETPELELDEGEATKIADAVANVAAQYEHKLNPKVMAWLNLAMVSGGIYGTRIFAIRARIVAEVASKSAPKPQPQVVNIRQTRTETEATVAQAQTPSDLHGWDYSGSLPDSGTY
jgi:hypothetical protein